MPKSAIPRTCAVEEEAAFNTAPANWDSGPDEYFASNTNLDGLQQEPIENVNHVQHELERHQLIKGVKQSEFSQDLYLHGSPATAAEEAQAVSIVLDVFLKSYAGGRKLGYSTGIAAGDATNPTVESATNLDEDADVLFFYDTSATAGYFRTITGIASTTLTLYGGDIPFTPDAGGADVGHAVITIYPHGEIMTDHSDADHTTLGYKIQGRGTEDVHEIYGCKPNFTLNDLVANNPSLLSMNVLATSFIHETASKSTLDTAPAGEPGIVVGTGCDTLVYLMAKDGSYTSTNVRSIVPRLGIEYSRDEGPNGCEGVHGYVGAVGDPGVTIVIDDDDDYNTGFRAEPGTEYSMLIQVGTDKAKAWALEFMRLEVAEDPIRTEVNGIASKTVNFRALRYDGATAVTGDDLEWFRAPWRLYLVA